MRKIIVTLLCANSATGLYIPPIFSFKRKKMAEDLMTTAPSDSISVCTDTGWNNDIMFMKWLENFITISKEFPHEKQLIILDGHHTHKTLAVIEYARTKGI